MGLQFEGVFDNLNETQLNFISDVIKKKGYMDAKVTFEAVGKEGDNYMANVKRIIVRDDNNKELRIIVKIAPQHEAIRVNVNIEQIFKNEHLIYTLFMPKFQQLEEEAEIPKEDRFRFPECYGSYTTAPYEMILLEDLAIPGFSILDKFKPLSDEYIKSVLRNFALLHSLSFVLKHKELETFNEYKNGLFDMWGNMEKAPGIDMFFKTMETFASMIVDGDIRKNHLTGCLERGFSLCSKLAKQDAGSKFSVIVHGDAWTNNILFKGCEDSLLESILIDYQGSKESNPTSDVLFMILNCTDHITLMEHFNDWIDYYHSELEKALNNHGLRINYVYPREQLDADMEIYAKVIFGITVFQGIGLNLKPEDAKKMMELFQTPVGQLSEIKMDYDEETTQVIKKRFESFVDSLVNLGLL